jgi:gamma-glutamylcyclotransferase (GGCT)/AIG2-like uncharacterized protein YtfP
MNDTIVAAIIQAVPQAIVSLGAVAAGLWALHTYRRSRRLEAAKWLQQLYADFYASEKFDEMRIDLEYEYFRATAPVVQKRISDRHVPLSKDEMRYLRHFDNFLNYFENLLYLRECEQVQRDDILAIFDYWFSLMRRDAFGAVRTYTAFGFERLAAELQAEPCRAVFLTEEQIRQLAQSAPASHLKFATMSVDAVIKCATIRRSGGGGGLIEGSGEPAHGRLTRLETLEEGLQLARTLDSILDFDASRERPGYRVRQCVMAFDGSNRGTDAWVWLDEAMIHPATPEEMTTPFLLLYGSLRPGQPSYAELGLSSMLKPIGEARVFGDLVDLGQYPGAKLGGASEIVCSLFEMGGSEVLKVLDRFEHFDPADTSPYKRDERSGSLYVRKVVETLCGQSAYIYEYNGELIDGSLRTGPIVPHGDWVRWMQERLASA